MFLYEESKITRITQRGTINIDLLFMSLNGSLYHCFVFKFVAYLISYSCSKWYYK